MTEGSSIAHTARALIRKGATAALATQSAEDGPWPYVSLVTAACDYDGTPILLLSDLAVHSKNIAADDRVSLLFTEGGEGDVLERARVTLLGRAERTEEPRHRARFLARHPEAEGYAGFKDFHFYKVAMARAHLVAGFGRIHWIEAEALRYGGDWAELAEAEAGIVEHMNADHADALKLYAERLLELPPAPTDAPWHMTGIDPEGLDMAAGAMTARLSFAEAVLDANQARAALVALAHQARGEEAPPGGE